MTKRITDFEQVIGLIENSSPLEVVGMSPDVAGELAADPDAIRIAARGLVRAYQHRYHPDTNPDGAEPKERTVPDLLRNLTLAQQELTSADDETIKQMARLLTQRKRGQLPKIKQELEQSRSKKDKLEAELIKNHARTLLEMIDPSVESALSLLPGTQIAVQSNQPDGLAVVTIGEQPFRNGVRVFSTGIIQNHLFEDIERALPWDVLNLGGNPEDTIVRSGCIVQDDGRIIAQVKDGTWKEITDLIPKSTKKELMTGYYHFKGGPKTNSETSSSSRSIQAQWIESSSGHLRFDLRKFRPMGSESTSSDMTYAQFVSNHDLMKKLALVIGQKYKQRKTSAKEDSYSLESLVASGKFTTNLVTGNRLVVFNPDTRRAIPTYIIQGVIPVGVEKL